MSKTAKTASVAAIAFALAGCIASIGANCTRDPMTGRVTCQGEYTPPPPPPLTQEQGERG